MPLTTVGPYRIVAKLGEGGMGAVYAAEHTRLGKRVAIKVLHGPYAQSPEAVARFVNEARASASIGNPHIVDVSDLGDLPEGGQYLVMELLEGRSLGDALEQDGPFSVERFFHVFAQLCDALGAAHARGIVHRDLKPENLFLVTRGQDRDFVKVLDFGISKMLDPDSGQFGMTRTGALMGTPFYMSPEQANGERDIDARSDIYALGVIAFELLTGARPFEAPSIPALLLKITAAPIPPIESLRVGLPASVIAGVQSALAKSKGERPPTCAALLSALRGEERVAKHVALSPTLYAPAGASPSSPGALLPDTLAGTVDRAPGPRASSSAPWPAGLVGGAVAVALLVGGGVAFMRRSSARSGPVTVVLSSAPSASPVPMSTSPALALSAAGPSASVAPVRVQPEPSPADARALPLTREPEVLALVRSWRAAVVDQQARGDLSEVYASEVRFRTLTRSTPTAIAHFWNEAMLGGATLMVDVARSRVRVEREDEEPRARATCVVPADAEGPIYKVRLWLEEHSEARAADIGCPTLEGVYLLRARRFAGGLRICHETWSLREGVCASCPTARACQSREALVGEGLSATGTAPADTGTSGMCLAQYTAEDPDGFHLRPTATTAPAGPILFGPATFQVLDVSDTSRARSGLPRDWLSRVRVLASPNGHVGETGYVFVDRSMVGACPDASLRARLFQQESASPSAGPGLLGQVVRPEGRCLLNYPPSTTGGFHLRPDANAEQAGAMVLGPATLLVLDVGTSSRAGGARGLEWLTHVRVLAAANGHAGDEGYMFADRQMLGDCASPAVRARLLQQTP